MDFEYLFHKTGGAGVGIRGALDHRYERHPPDEFLERFFIEPQDAFVAVDAQIALDIFV